MGFTLIYIITSSQQNILKSEFPHEVVSHSRTWQRLWFNLLTAIPRFSIRIKIRVRHNLMRTPYSTFQYPSNVSSYVSLFLNVLT